MLTIKWKRKSTGYIRNIWSIKPRAFQPLYEIHKDWKAGSYPNIVEVLLNGKRVCLTHDIVDTSIGVDDGTEDIVWVSNEVASEESIQEMEACVPMEKQAKTPASLPFIDIKTR